MGLWDINQYCPVCGLEFEREPGYFLGAMYFSYGLSVITGLPTFIILFLWGMPNLWILIILALQLGLSSPLLVRYSRALWLHMDQIVDPC